MNLLLEQILQHEQYEDIEEIRMPQITLNQYQIQSFSQFPRIKKLTIHRINSQIQDFAYYEQSCGKGPLTFIYALSEVVQFEVEPINGFEIENFVNVPLGSAKRENRQLFILEVEKA